MLRVCWLDFVTFRENGRVRKLDRLSFWLNEYILHVVVDLATAELVFRSNTADLIYRPIKECVNA